MVADADRGIAAVAGRPAEDQYDLDTVFVKFDQHWGVAKYRTKSFLIHEEKRASP